MLTYTAKRLLALIPIMLGVAVVTFILLLLIPGDPVNVLLPPGTPPEAREAYREELRLNERVDQRFVAWLAHAMQGDLGQSIARLEPARDVVLRALANTAQLAVAGIVLAIVLGLGFGMAMGWWEDRLAGRFLNGFVVSAASVPQFWLGLILLYIFAIKLGLLPTGGMEAVTGDGGLIVRLKHLTLPALTVAMLPMAIISRMTRTLFLELKNQDFVVTLRTRGYSTLRIWRHVLRNAAPGVLNITGLQAGYVILGTLFAEVVFSWPGLGTHIVAAVDSRDYPVIQGIVLFSGALFACITIIVDVGIRALDPRTENS